MTDFQSPDFSDPTAFRDWALQRLQKVEIEAADDPLTNGVRRLAFELSNYLERGLLGLGHVAALAKLISDDACVARARAFASTHPKRGDWARRVRAALSTFEGAGIETVKAELARTRAGIVFTAHPTFANNRNLRRAFASFASAELDEAEFRSQLNSMTHGPDPSITLFDEHAEVIEAISRAQEQLRALTEEIFKWAEPRFPDDWSSLEPAPMSLATWVGYDLDGRTDIHWGQTFRFRLEEKSRQLSVYAASLRRVGAGEARIADIAGRLERAATLAELQAEKFSGDLEDPSVVVEAANTLTSDHPDRLTSLAEIREELRELIRRTSSNEIKRALAVTCAEMRAFGLGAARVHLRVNAAQVRSALQQEFEFAPDRAFIERTALAAAAAKSADVRAKQINFANVFLEKMTARRQFMLCAQFAKHVDADTPIRFLIAECEAPATIMGAIYLARLYGVENMVDISPLFETPEALERGGRFIERLLDEEEFREYIRARGRIAIQLGFSDSGRFIGQISADMAIERLHILLARELAEHGVTDVEALVFNTHGESMGRGGFPGSLKERFDHLMTPWARARFAHHGISINAEASFQGGDGFLHFETPALAEATVGALFDWAFEIVRKDDDDQFYKDINFSWDVFRAIENWQEALFANASYQAALGAFAPNFLVSTGSRKVRRQSGASKNDAARSLRAIPHNAILQQLAAPANVFGGMGHAAHREPDRFVELVRASGRMRGLVKMAATARGLTSLSILRSYGSLFDPGFWTVRARHSETPDISRRFYRIAQALTPKLLDVDLNRLANVLSIDRKQFDDVGAASLAPDASMKFNPELYVLHALRMALVMHGFSLAAGVPSYSGRHEITPTALIELAFSMQFAEVAALIAEIFPLAPREREALGRIVEPAESSDSTEGYREVQQRFAAPLEKLDGIVKDIGVGIAHFYRAYG